MNTQDTGTREHATGQALARPLKQRTYPAPSGPRRSRLLRALPSQAPVAPASSCRTGWPRLWLPRPASSLGSWFGWKGREVGGGGLREVDQDAPVRRFRDAIRRVLYVILHVRFRPPVCRAHRQQEEMREEKRAARLDATGCSRGETGARFGPPAPPLPLPSTERLRKTGCAREEKHAEGVLFGTQRLFSPRDPFSRANRRWVLGGGSGGGRRKATSVTDHWLVFGKGVCLRPIKRLRSVAVFLTLELILAAPATPTARSLEPRPTMQGVLRDDASLSITSMPPLRAMATTQF